jgi:hypothetical protein
MIGKFGEGLKLGILALVRLGAKIKIRSGSEVWVPRIVRSEKFNADVLAFDIAKGREHKERVQIEICNCISQEVWNTIQSKFLFLQKTKGRHRIDTAYNGAILTSTEHQGSVFVRGIHVFKNPALRYGYDLTDVDIDRDRKMVDQSSLRWRLCNLWRSAVNEFPDMATDYIQLLDDQATDLEGLDMYTAKQLAESVRVQVAEKFLARHGKNALPVSSLSQSAEVEHLGMNGVVVSGALRAVLEAQLGSAEENKAKLVHLPKHTYGWGELSDAEKANLISAIALVNSQEPVTLDDIDVVDFRSDTLEGLFTEGRVLLAKDRLAKPATVLEVLVHEVAHRKGSDGEKAHVAQIEKIWSGIVAQLRGQS